MVNYANGKIYMICPIVEHDEGEIYIGSTTKYYLSDRMHNHRDMYECYKIGRGCGRYAVYDLFDKYGVHNCGIFLIENFSANSKNELFAREGYHIRNTKCVNKYQPGISREEVLEKKKQYKKDNVEKNKEYNEARKQKVDCECGRKVAIGELHRHKKTILHISLCAEMNALPSP